jgi:hypothetical protein
MSPDGDTNAAAAANASAVARDINDADDDNDDAAAAVAARACLFKPLMPRRSVSNRTHNSLPSTA